MVDKIPGFSMLPIKWHKEKHTGEFLMPNSSLNSPLFICTFIKRAFIDFRRARGTYLNHTPSTKLKQPTWEENAWNNTQATWHSSHPDFLYHKEAISNNCGTLTNLWSGFLQIPSICQKVTAVWRVLLYQVGKGTRLKCRINPSTAKEQHLPCAVFTKLLLPIPFLRINLGIMLNWIGIWVVIVLVPPSALFLLA